MTSAGSVGSDGAIRLFLALRLPAETLDALEAWADAALSGGRRVPRSQLHVTLAFLGSRPRADVPAVVETLRGAALVARPIALEPRAWRETERVGMVVLADHAGAGAALADDLASRLETLGMLRRERRPWLPHVTVQRHRGRPGLQPPLPSMGTLVPSDAAAFLSRPRAGGSDYEVLATAPLGERKTADMRARDDGIGRMRRMG